MNVIHRRGWDIPEHQATPESVFLNRRALLGAGAEPRRRGARARHRATRSASPTFRTRPRISIRPSATRNTGSTAARSRRKRSTATTIISTNSAASKNVTKAAQALKIRPWMVKIDGMVEKPFEIAIDDLIRKMPLEERLYRHRCVEAWSMTIPWSGFQMSHLMALAKPTSSAKYVVMQTFQDNSAPGFRQSWYPWPYTEGLTIEEANNELTFLVTGMYGKPALKQMGAPLRLAVPWKYGFKSVKSIVRFEFTDKRPKTFWEGLQAAEYGFWANVNPGGAASALEPGHGRRHRHQGAPADREVQRLRRVRRRSLQGHGEDGTALGVDAPTPILRRSVINLKARRANSAPRRAFDSLSRPAEGCGRRRAGHVGAGDDRRRQTGIGCRRQALSARRARGGGRQGRAVVQRRSLRRLGHLEAGAGRARVVGGKERHRAGRGEARRAAALSRQGAVRRRQLLRPHGRDGLSRREEGDAAAVLLLQAAAQCGGRAGRDRHDAARHQEIRLGDRARGGDRQDRALRLGRERAVAHCRLHGRDRSVGARFQPGAGPVLQIRLGGRKGDRHRVPAGAVDRAGGSARRRAERRAQAFGQRRGEAGFQHQPDDLFGRRADRARLRADDARSGRRGAHRNAGRRRRAEGHVP